MKSKIVNVNLVVLLIYALVIAWFSLTPGEDSEPYYFLHEDKVVHFFAYFMFVALSLPVLSNRRAIYAVGVGVFLFGGLIELGQSYVPMRDMSFLDILANTAGMLTGIFITLKFRQCPCFQRLLQA